MDEGQLELTWWATRKGHNVVPGQEVEFDGRTYREDEAGEAQYTSEGTTGLPPQGRMRYRDYRDGASLLSSQFEPCGIAQMNAMHYGTVPIVHETGGLVDTVVPFNERADKGTGFCFYSFTPEVFLNTIENAADVFWNQKEKWHSLKVRAMEKDFSWTASAKIYIEEYKKLLNE